MRDPCDVKFCILTVSVSISWMWYFTIVLQSVHLEENWVKETWISIYLKLKLDLQWSQNQRFNLKNQYRKVDWTKMIISINDRRRMAIHNIISLNPVYQTQKGLVIRILAENLGKFCSKSDNIVIKKLRFSSNSFIVCEVLGK